MEEMPNQQEETRRRALREKLLGYEARIDEYHARGKGSPEGRGGVESLAREIDIDEETLGLIALGEETLGLGEEEISRFSALREDFLQGRLNDPGREEDFEEFFNLADRFEITWKNRKTH